MAKVMKDLVRPTSRIKAHICYDAYHDFIPLYFQIIFHCMATPHFWSFQQLMDIQSLSSFIINNAARTLELTVLCFYLWEE